MLFTKAGGTPLWPVGRGVQTSVLVQCSLWGGECPSIQSCRGLSLLYLTVPGYSRLDSTSLQKDNEGGPSHGRNGYGPGLEVACIIYATFHWPRVSHMTQRTKGWEIEFCSVPRKRRREAHCNSLSSFALNSTGTTFMKQKLQTRRLR